MNFLRNLLRRPDRFPPNLTAAMDGTYTRVVSPHGTLVLIICDVRAAKQRPGMLHASWTPYDGGPKSPNAWRVDAFSPALRHTRRPAKDGVVPFTLLSDGEGKGSFDVSAEGTEHVFEVDIEKVGRRRIVLNTSNRVPWCDGSATTGPEGWISRLGSILPLHWHVQSRGSRAWWRVESLDGQQAEDGLGRGWAGEGVAHMEKNWCAFSAGALMFRADNYCRGTSFPPNWIWLQAVPNPSSTPSASEPAFSFALAGGLLPSFLPSLPPLPFEAYLSGLRVPSASIEWDFRPPWTLRVLGWSPWTSISRDAKHGRLRLTLHSAFFRRRVVVESIGDPVSSSQDLQ